MGTNTKPQLDAPTRWNSTYTMIIGNLKMTHPMDECILKQGKNYNVIRDLCAVEFGFDRNSPQIAKALSPQEWNLLQTIANILAPINNATHAMCAENYSTMSLMTPFFDEILDLLESNSASFRNQGEDLDLLADRADAAYEKLLQYFFTPKMT